MVEQIRPKKPSENFEETHKMNVEGGIPEPRFEGFVEDFSRWINIIVCSNSTFRKHVIINEYDAEERGKSYSMEFTTSGLIQVLEIISSSPDNFLKWWNNKLKLVWGDELIPLPPTKNETLLCSRCKKIHELKFTRKKDNDWKWELDQQSLESKTFHQSEKCEEWVAPPKKIKNKKS
jgi:hypothetical protein